MKKAFVLLPALLLTAGAAHAQDNVVKLDIFQPAISTLSLSFEHKLSESSSFQMSVAGTFGYKEDYDDFGSFGSFDAERKTSGIALTPEYRFYLSEKHPALEGFYVAPYLRFQHLSQTGQTNSTGSSRPYEASLNAFGLGVTVGRHWIFKQRFSLDAFVGPGYHVASVTTNQTEDKVNKSDFVGYFENVNYDLRGGVTFGIAF